MIPTFCPVAMLVIVEIQILIMLMIYLCVKFHVSGSKYPLFIATKWKDKHKRA